MSEELKPCPYMEIQLTRGKVAKVSPEDYDELSKFKGVYWSTNDNSWVVQIKENGRYRTIHGIQSEDIAGMIYDLLALDRFKEYARFNNPKFIEAWNPRHEPDELPEWFVNKLNESIIDCGLLEAELKDDNDIEEAVRVSRRANTLRWVLSLRKQEIE
jgi:hypothetical protein